MAPRVMTLAQFAAATGGKTTADVDGHIHAGLRSKPGTKTYARFFDRKFAQLRAERDATKAAYDAAIAAGEIAAPAAETLEEIAERDTEQGEAARRVIAKRAARKAAK